MHARLAIGLLWGVWLTACQTVVPTSTMTPTLTATSTPNPPPTHTPRPVASPTATLLVQGLIVRFGTADPSPDCPDHYPWFFDNPAHECASTLSNTWGTVQHFEHGLMVWFQ